MVIGMLWVVYFDIYALLDSRENPSFVRTYLAIKFDVRLEILLETFFSLYPCWWFSYG